MTEKYKYTSLLERGYDEYSLSKKYHKKIFPYGKLKCGMIKYRYYEKNGCVEIECWYSPLFLLWVVLMFMPSVIVVGFPETLNQIKEALKNIFKCPVTTYNMTRKLLNGKINSNYEEFMKYATLKTKGKENVEMV